MNIVMWLERHNLIEIDGQQGKKFEWKMGQIDRLLEGVITSVTDTLTQNQYQAKKNMQSQGSSYFQTPEKQRVSSIAFNIDNIFILKQFNASHEQNKYLYDNPRDIKQNASQIGLLIQNQNGPPSFPMY